MSCEILIYNASPLIDGCGNLSLEETFCTAFNAWAMETTCVATSLEGGGTLAAEERAAEEDISAFQSNMAAAWIGNKE